MTRNEVLIRSGCWLGRPLARRSAPTHLREQDSPPQDTRRTKLNSNVKQKQEFHSKNMLTICTKTALHFTEMCTTRQISGGPRHPSDSLKCFLLHCPSLLGPFIPSFNMSSVLSFFTFSLLTNQNSTHEEIKCVHVWVCFENRTLNDSYCPYSEFPSTSPFPLV